MTQNSLEARGLQTEVPFGSRYADAAGPGEIHQIGGLNQRGDPIARERDAINPIARERDGINDILNSPEYNGEAIYFWNKENPMAAPIENPYLRPEYGGRK